MAIVRPQSIPLIAGIKRIRAMPPNRSRIKRIGTAGRVPAGPLRRRVRGSSITGDGPGSG
jgi:hypothetical protein